MTCLSHLQSQQRPLRDDFALSQLRSGDLKLIGVMSPDRDPDFPDVSVVAATVPGYSAVGFMSLAAPAGTPEPVVRQLNEDLSAALETPSVKQRLTEFGVRAKIVTPAEATAYVEREQKLWWPLVKEFDSK